MKDVEIMSNSLIIRLYRWLIGCQKEGRKIQKNQMLNFSEVTARIK